MRLILTNYVRHYQSDWDFVVCVHIWAKKKRNLLQWCNNANFYLWNVIWSGSNSKEMNRVLKLQKRAAKIILKVERTTPSIKLIIFEGGKSRVSRYLKTHPGPVTKKATLSQRCIFRSRPRLGLKISRKSRFSSFKNYQLSS